MQDTEMQMSSYYGSCGTSCDCAPNKCNNRDIDLFKKLDGLQQLKMAEGIGNYLGIGASHNLLLLHSALVDKLTRRNNNYSFLGHCILDYTLGLINCKDGA